jgi:thiamine biosynthesis protein ThiI
MDELTTRHAVVHYGEIGLKGRNRPFFERALARNIARRLDDVGVAQVERLRGRFVVHLEKEQDEAVWAQALGTVFGIAHFAPAFLVGRTMVAIRAAVLARLPECPVESFAIRAVRADKTFPLTSPEIECELGAAIQERTGWPVRLKDPVLTISVEVLRDRAIVSLGRLPGPGGLPVGVSGRVGLLLSGGIDSPVAGWMMLKRGCRVIPIHFHSRPFGNWRGSEARARRLVRALQPYGMAAELFAVPIGRQQREIAVLAPDTYRVILYRRLMVRVAERLIRQEGGKALATGESLGQVASQTLEALSVVEQAAEIALLRPLVGLDKQEIVDRATGIRTFELSQLPGDDCCQFLMPGRVETRPRFEDVLAAEQKLDMVRLVQDALDHAECLRASEEFPGGRVAHIAGVAASSLGVVEEA